MFARKLGTDQIVTLVAASAIMLTLEVICAKSKSVRLIRRYLLISTPEVTGCGKAMDSCAEIKVKSIDSPVLGCAKSGHSTQFDFNTGRFLGRRTCV